MKNSAYKVFKRKTSVQELFRGFKDGRMPFLLESSRDVMGLGRYSFFGSDPFLVISCKDGACSVERDGRVEKKTRPPLSVLRELLDAYTLRGHGVGCVPLLAGAVGFISYDFGFSLEKIARHHKGDARVPDFLFGFYDSIVAVDHKKDEVLAFSSGFPEKGASRQRRCAARLKETLEKLECRSPLDKVALPGAGESALISNFTRRAYLAAVRKAQAYIAAGDIYQVNLSQKFRTRCAIDDWLLYRRLSRNFPVSFSAFLKNEDLCVISASPERFLHFDGCSVKTRPMKGTRRRTDDVVFNRKMRKELVLSKKEKAELLMIVDLERNDLGRVCAYGSIRVRHLRQIEAYRSVFQATAQIEGRLHASKDRIDLLRACFPGGSITGCPKIRAMEIIEELEPDTRALYTGALGYLSFHNTMDFNVLIRSFLKIKDAIVFHVGGGIVSDSRPADEYEETLVKAKVLMEALRHAG
jgi:para-aminobenzoate synthetase component 1